MSEAVALGLDLGTTRIKAGVLGRSGRLIKAASVATPALDGIDPIREGNPEAYLAAAADLLRAVGDDLPRTLPVGIATQRSTLLLWERATGTPLTPMISWLDRRAAPWCERHAAAGRAVALRTGLRLSPHYVGPKLATLLEADARLAGGLAAGELLFGNLDAFLLRRLAAAPSHLTDPTMAGRTLLVDPVTRAWSEEMLRFFGVPRACLPAIEPSAGRALPLASGHVVTAMLADQASGAFALLGSEPDALLVNLGTGGFVLRIAGADELPAEGFLRGPAAPAGGSFPPLFLLEGTINGLGDSLGRGPTALPDVDPSPDAFCLPDAAGVGSPYWLPHVPRTFSPAAESLDAAAQRRVLLEGVLFRVRGIVEALCAERPARRVLLSGGLSRDAFLARGLAACLALPIEIVEEPEATLLGAACLAAGRSVPQPALRHVPPSDDGAYLVLKFERWKSWLRGIV